MGKFNNEKYATDLGKFLDDLFRITKYELFTQREKEVLGRIKEFLIMEQLGIYFFISIHSHVNPNKFCLKFKEKKVWHIDEYLNLKVKGFKKFKPDYKGVLIDCGVSCSSLNEHPSDYSCYNMISVISNEMAEIGYGVNIKNYRIEGPGEVFTKRTLISFRDEIARICDKYGILEK